MQIPTALFLIFILITQTSAKNVCELDEIQQCLKSELAKAALTGSTTTFGAFISAKLALWMAGFSSLGPVAGSLAAWLQAAYGIGPIFSLLQSLAMGKLTLILGPAVAVGCITAFIYWVTSCLRLDCIFSESEKERRQEKNKSYWDQIKNFASKYYEIIKSKSAYLLEIIQIAIDLLWEEFYKQQQQQDYMAIFLEQQKKSYSEDSTPNNIFECFTYYL